MGRGFSGVQHNIDVMRAQNLNGFSLSTGVGNARGIIIHHKNWKIFLKILKIISIITNYEKLLSIAVENNLW